MGETEQMYRLAYVYNFLLIASIGSVFIFLSDIKEEYGFSGGQIGLIASLGFFVVLPVTPIVSRLADRGFSGPLLGVSIITAVVGNLFFGFGNTYWHFVLSRVLLGVAIGIGSIAIRKAIIGDDIEGSGKKLGALLSMSVAGFLLGPPLGAFLEPYGFATVFIVFAVSCIVIGVPVSLWAWRVPVSTSELSLASVGRLLRKRGLQASLLGYTTLFGFVGVFDSTIDIYLEDLGASNADIAKVLLFVGLPLVILPSPVGSFVEGSNPRRIFFIGMVIAAFSIAGYGLFANVVAFAIAGFIHSTVESFTFTSSQVITVSETGAAESAAGQALLEAFGAVSAGAFAFAGPVVFEAFGPRVLFFGYGLLILISAVGVRVLLSDGSQELAPAEPMVV